MCRGIVGTLVQAGQGKIAPAGIKQILRRKGPPRRRHDRPGARVGLVEGFLLTMNIVLVEPEIPPNTGNVARLCAADARHAASDRTVGLQAGGQTTQARRAGLLAAPGLASLAGLAGISEATSARRPALADRIAMVRDIMRRRDYQAGDYLVFGRETAGLPQKSSRNIPGGLAAHADV